MSTQDMQQKRRSVPIPALPATLQQGQPGHAPQPLNRRRGDNPPRPPGDGGGVMRSSLELVFSYSRSQQRFFGGLPSAPSFVDGHSFSSWSSRYNTTDDADAEPSRRRRNRYDPESGMTTTDTEGDGEGEGDGDGEGEGGETSHDEASPTGRPHSEPIPSSDSPVLFPVDPVSRRASDEDTGPIDQPRPLPLARPFSAPAADSKSGPQTVLPLPPAVTDTSGGPSAPASLRLNTAAGPAGAGLISFFSPKSNALNLSSSVGTSSTGSQTPRGGQHPRLPDTGSEGRPSPTHPGQRALLSRVEEERADKKGPPATESTPLLAGTKPAWEPGRLSPQPSAASLDAAGRRRSQATIRRRKSMQSLGESTDFQTGFNAVALLVGIGLLSMPLAFSYAGWIGGTGLLLGFAWITCHTAKLLARLIFADPNMQGYTDIGRRAFGRWGGSLVECLFCLELFALGVALIVLFGDSLNAIFPSVSSNTFKLMGYFLILPTTLMPLRLLSIPSLLSTLSTLLLIGIVVADGLWKSSSPGSLREPMPTNLGPELTNANWLGGVGLILAGLGGHAVVPSLARDMRNPANFDRVISWAFFLAASVSFVSGAAGYLMIGNTVSDEITRDLMQPKYGYPRGLNLFALWMIVMGPLTKFGLCSRPLNITLETIFGITPSTLILHPELDPSPAEAAESSIARVSRASICALSFAGASDYHPPPGLSPLHTPHSRRVSSPATSTANTRVPGSPPKSPTPGGTVSPLQSGMAATAPVEGAKGVSRIIVRAVVTACCVGTAVGLPGFGRVMAFLGSFSAMLICVILPLAFHLRLDGIGQGRRKVGARSKTARAFGKAGHVLLLIAGVVMMVAGTVWAFIPGTGHGELEP